MLNISQHSNCSWLWSQDCWAQCLHEREIKDPGQLVDGEMETVNLRFIDTVEVGESTEPRGLPVSLSAVVIGSILSGECFVDEVRTTVYTDYKVKIVQVLKDSTATLSGGSPLRANISETGLVLLINEQKGEKEEIRDEREFSWCCSFPWGFGCRETERRLASRRAAAEYSGSQSGRRSSAGFAARSRSSCQTEAADLHS